MNFKVHFDQNPIFGVVARAAQELGVASYLVGGYVRDRLLERPSKDMDFVCVGNGIELAQKAARILGKSVQVTVFKNFGTAQIKRSGIEMEFVGARKESYRENSRKPMVESGSLQDDLNRRDFTINTLVVSLNPQDFGQLVDVFDGQRDLQKKLIKTPLDPDKTFSDDPLRMMRAIRFAAQLNFDIESETFESMARNAARLSIVSMERITDELNKIISSPKPSYGIKLLYHAQLLEVFFPELVALHGVETINGKSHKDNFYHTLKVLDNVAEVSDDLWIRWAAILHDIAKPLTKRYYPKSGWTFHGHEDKGAKMVGPMFRRFKLPMNEKMKFVRKLVRLHLRPIPLVKDHITDSALRRLLSEAGDDIDALMLLCRADITSKNHFKVKQYLQNFDLVERKLQAVENKDKIRNLQPAITGNDIMKILKIGPSKIIGEIKEEIKEAILEGKIDNNYQDGYDYLIEIAEKKGLPVT